MSEHAPPLDADAHGSGAFVIAHRAGNDLAQLRRARALGVPLVEADVHLFAGRLEVRHLKTVGPIPILWDRWAVAPPWSPRLLLDQLLSATAGGSELMLDLKGRDVRLSRLVMSAIGEHAPGRPLTVCSQQWELLDPLDGLPGVRLVHSVGSARQLARLSRRFAGRRLAGVSIHRGLLDAATVRDLRSRADLIMTWPVEGQGQARTLAGWGVQGLITSRFAELMPMFAGTKARVAVA